ncbi:MAG: lipid-A-disaccharide synthase [Leptospirillia bacterium]
MSACEASADLHGAHLMDAIRRIAPDARIEGIGGDRMTAAGLEPVFHARELSVMGIAEVLGKLGVVRRAFAKAAAMFSKGETDVAVLIDSPDFNLRLAARARAAGVPVVYFIGPKVWAWRKGRLKTIGRLVDHMMVILPFEVGIYERAGIPATFVGNPLVDEMAGVKAGAPADGRFRPSDFGLKDDRPTVGLFPGSRGKEIDTILPGLLAAAEQLARQLPEVQFLLPVADTLDLGVIESRVRAATDAAKVPVTCVDGRAVEAMTACDAVAMASGTVTLQAALAGVPGVIVYRMSPITWALVRRMVGVKYAGLVNLVADDAVVPELLQDAFTPEAVCEQLFRVLSDPDAAAAQRTGLETVRERLGDTGAPERAARIVLARAGRAA